MLATRSCPPLVLLLLVVAAVMLAVGCRSDGTSDTRAAKPPPTEQATEQATETTTADEQLATALAPAPLPGEAVATFAGGCFWCMEGPFERIDGVREVLSGYTGGPERGPSYGEVSSGRTGHTEAVRVYFDPERVSYEALLEAFWRSMDPTDADGQFADRGSQYRPAIFVHSAEQRARATASRDALEESGRFEAPIIVPIEDAADFWVAEDYHQDYYRTNPGPFARYYAGSGRKAFLERVWKE